jgi:predicted nucleic acid-binding Zn ribbon protein
VTPRWRPLPGEDRPPRRVGESLDRVAAALGVTRATTLTGIFASWDELVGDAVAQHVRPRSLRDKTLLVVVDDPSWATQMRWLEADLLTRLVEVLGPGQVDRIEVRVVAG